MGITLLISIQQTGALGMQQKQGSLNTCSISTNVYPGFYHMVNKLTLIFFHIFSLLMSLVVMCYVVVFYWS